MAIYRIFPEKDALIYTEKPEANSGKDEILEIAGYTDVEGIARTARTLIKFSNNDIDYVLNNLVTGPFTASLNLFLAEASEIPVSNTIYGYPVSQSWDEGIGKFNDLPVDKSGVSWQFRIAGSRNPWTITGFASGSSGSYSSTQPGGGTWYTNYSGSSLEFTQSFFNTIDHDLKLNVTPAIELFYSGSLINDGFIIKLDNSLEAQTTSSIRIKYFSSNTNTIYPPFLEFKWDDSSYITGSLQVLETSNITVGIKNNRGKYIDQGKQRFRLSCKPQYLVRTFTTSSIYLTNYALPVDSYWGLLDENSKELVVSYDTTGTKISCDSQGPYFDIYMDGLQPERYYRIVVKSNIDGTTTVFEDKNIFKIVKNA